MSANIIDGKALAEQVKQDVRRNVGLLAQRGLRPNLIAILVGESPEAELYAANQKKSCEAIGIGYELRKLTPTTDSSVLASTIKRLNVEAGVTGIMLHLPLPPHLDVAEM